MLLDLNDEEINSGDRIFFIQDSHLEPGIFLNMFGRTVPKARIAWYDFTGEQYIWNIKLGSRKLSELDKPFVTKRLLKCLK